jgi:hypothetical protein
VFTVRERRPICKAGGPVEASMPHFGKKRQRSAKGNGAFTDIGHSRRVLSVAS